MYNITYSHLQSILPKIAEEIRKIRDTSKELILVGVPRGGMYLTQDLAYVLGVKRILLAEENCDISYLNYEEKQIIVCDDIYDTGNVYQKFKSLWKHPQNRMCVQLARYRESLPDNVICGDTLEFPEYVWFPWEV